MPKYRRFEVVAIFDSGMFEYDTSLAFISLPTAQRFFNLGDAVTGLQVKVDLDVDHLRRRWRTSCGASWGSRIGHAIGLR